METKAVEHKPTASDVWMRGLLMLLFMIGFTVGQWLLYLVAIVQFVWLLVAREPSSHEFVDDLADADPSLASDLLHGHCDIVSEVHRGAHRSYGSAS